MKTQETVELLNIHADGLNRGVDLTDPLAAVSPEPEQSLSRDLLQLARRVKHTLVPNVEPRLTFVNDLKARLLKNYQPPVVTVQPTPAEQRKFWIAVGAGIALAIGSLITAILGWRLRRHPPKKPHTAQ